MKFKLFGIFPINTVSKPTDIIFDSKMLTPITPEMMLSNNCDLALVDFNNRLSQSVKGSGSYELISDIVYCDTICKMLIAKYEEAGWHAQCYTYKNYTNQKETKLTLNA